MTDQLTKNIVSMYGETGREWLESIPSIVKKYEEKWGISVLLGESFPLTYNYVAPAVREDGTQVVLKFGFREYPHIWTEMEALKIFNGKGAVKLLELDEENTAMLLERVIPGDTLRSVPEDEKVIAILASVIKKLDRPAAVAASFPTIANWAEGFARLRKAHGGTTGPFPKELFEKAEKIFSEYDPSKGERYLLHGDLHYDNILRSERGWLVIDPKGIIGEKEFETAMFLNDPFSDLREGTNRVETVKKRIDQLASELGYNKQKILNWAFAQSMLSAVWILEDHKEVSEIGMRNVQLLNDLI